MKEHWEKLFSTRAENEVSWYQPYPTVSMSFIESLELPPDAAIIDIGGGDSLLVDVLLGKDAEIASKAVKPGGHLIMGTFSEDGPTKCSGLDIRQYNAGSLCSCFERDFVCETSIQVNHYTPTGAEQNFLFCSLEREMGGIIT